MVKNPPANEGHIRDMGSVLGQEDLPEEGVATHSSILAWRIPIDRQQLIISFLGERSLMGYSPQGHKELDMTKETSHRAVKKLKLEMSIVTFYLQMPIKSYCYLNKYLCNAFLLYTMRY